MTSIQRLLAALSSAALLLSASPAYAFGLHLGVGSDASVKAGQHVATQTHTNATLAAQTNLGQAVKNFVHDYKDDHKDDKGHKNGTGSTLTAEQKITLYTTARTHATTALQRVFHKIADWSKRICNAQGDQSTVAACMNQAKIDFKAKVSAMIDAAFTL